MNIHGGVLGNLPFFQNRESAFVGCIVPLLNPLRIFENEYIYQSDDHPYDSKSAFGCLLSVFFLVHGRVDFVMDLHECVFKSWPQGSYFGEIEVIFKKKRLATCKAAVNCDLFSLNKKHY